MRNNIKSEYRKYKAEYTELRRAGLIKKGTRVFGEKKFAAFVADERRYENRTTAEARRDLLSIQKKFGELTKRDIKKLYKTYKENEGVSTTVITRGRRGEIIESSQEVTTTKFRSEATFMKNMKARDVITLLIESGLSKREAMEEYGYKFDDEEVF